MGGTQETRVTDVLEDMKGRARAENQTTERTCFGSPGMNSSKHLFLTYTLTLYIAYIYTYIYPRQVKSVLYLYIISSDLHNIWVHTLITTFAD